MTITETEILDAIREATNRSAGGPDDAMTIAELAEAMALSVTIARKRVVSMLKSGAMECVHVRRPSMDGRMMRVPAYRLIVSPKEKAKR